MVNREVFESVAILLTLGGTVAAAKGKEEETVLLAMLASLTAFMSLWSPGTSLLRLPSLRK